MAETVLFDTAGSIIRSLSSLALQEIGVSWGFKDELRKLEDTVSTIQAVLLDAEEKQAHNHAVKNWLRKLKDALYDADDLLDDYSTQLLRRQVMTRDEKKAKEVNSISIDVHPMLSVNKAFPNLHTNIYHNTSQIKYISFYVV
jgi:Asp-tRNA(Asn)/Glu-tRNA(Gln) amidotransferase C subunit